MLSFVFYFYFVFSFFLRVTLLLKAVFFLFVNALEQIQSVPLQAAPAIC